MKYKRKGLARRITLAAGAALMSGTLLFGSRIILLCGTG